MSLILPAPASGIEVPLQTASLSNAGAIGFTSFHDGTYTRYLLKFRQFKSGGSTTLRFRDAGSDKTTNYHRASMQTDSNSGTWTNSKSTAGSDVTLITQARTYTSAFDAEIHMEASNYPRVLCRESSNHSSNYFNIALAGGHWAGTATINGFALYGTAMYGELELFGIKDQ